MAIKNNGFVQAILDSYLNKEIEVCFGDISQILHQADSGINVFQVIVGILIGGIGDALILSVERKNTNGTWDSSKIFLNTLGIKTIMETKQLLNTKDCFVNSNLSKNYHG